MHLVSVNVGLPRDVTWKGKTVTTGIFKESTADRVMIRSLNLDGDGQADLAVHGGRDKAVYAYPSEHYSYWREQVPDMDLPWGMFGENLTTVGLREDEVNIGDRFRIGAAEIVATEPRMPCYKLGIRFGRPEIVKQFQDSRLTGIYFAVVQEGEIGLEDAIELVSRDERHVTVADITHLYLDKNLDNPANRDLMTRAIQVEALAAGWRDYFQQQLAKLA
ncbi:MAG: MOSC domain-containing protein [Cyanobacteria bacterium CRU_2_1]|nr:MOSC domain-containing protein [Cyanobacteria bacterium RU_5_0]NJR59751.1 MOSC domain-containing protein [Cyanobacteria bacterium CRU_2_1]